MFDLRNTNSQKAFSVNKKQVFPFNEEASTVNEKCPLKEERKEQRTSRLSVSSEWRRGNLLQTRSGRSVSKQTSKSAYYAGKQPLMGQYSITISSHVDVLSRIQSVTRLNGREQFKCFGDSNQLTIVSCRT